MVKRLTASSGSIPTQESISPAKPIAMPLTTLFSETEIIMVRPNKASMKYSVGPKEMVKLAMGKAKKIKKRVLIMPPITENMQLIPKASPPLP